MEILKKILDVHVLTGIVLGALIGLYYPDKIDVLKPLLVFLGVVMSVTVFGVKAK